MWCPSCGYGSEVARFPVCGQDANQQTVHKCPQCGAKSTPKMERPFKTKDRPMMSKKRREEPEETAEEAFQDARRPTNVI